MALKNTTSNPFGIPPAGRRIANINRVGTLGIHGDTEEEMACICRTRTMYKAINCIMQLTGMQLQIGNVLLQLPSQNDLGSVLPLGAIIHQQKVSMSIVQHGQFGAEKKWRRWDQEPKDSPRLDQKSFVKSRRKPLLILWSLQIGKRSFSAVTTQHCYNLHPWH